MRCARCDLDNPISSRFCAGCGSSLQCMCSQCGGANPPDAKFCGQCGSGLSVPGEAPARDGASPTEPDRRQLTIMFSDLVGSTALSERLDPEEWREVLQSYRDTCANVVSRYDGYLAQYAGDGIKFYFGYPHAHEDDAARAVHAGLDILRDLGGLSLRLQAERNIRLSARLGIHTGLVVAGDLGRGQSREAMAVIGDTPNIAARVQSLAPPDTLLISAATRSLVDGLFVFRDFGAQELKGLSHPMSVWQVVRQSDVRSPFEARVKRGLIPFVDRERETAELLDRWALAATGEGQVVFLSGEAGIGKSRVVREFKDRLNVARSSQILCYCSPYHSDSAFYPITSQLERVLRLHEADSVELQLDRLDAMLEHLGLPAAEIAPLLAAFLSLPTKDRYPALEPNPRQIKLRAMEASIRVIEAMAKRQPVLMLVEDAHWIDPSSLEFLALVVKRLSRQRLLMVLSHRPGFSVPWGRGDQVAHLELKRLPPEDCGRIVMTIGAGLTTQLRADIVAKADGVPLFVEELTKSVVDAEAAGQHGADRGPAIGRAALAVPSTLKDSLMARLDRLGRVKEVAQIAAIIGRQFSRGLLEAVCAMPEPELATSIGQLISAELIYQREAPEHHYEFKHVLVQDIAYQSLLRSTRQRYHGEIARILVERFPETAATKPELVAYHYTQAGLMEPAISYWRKASQRAMEHAANAEAVAHLDRAMQIVAALPQSSARDEQELMLLIARGPPLTAMGSYASPALRENYGRALELCRRIGNAPQIFPVLQGLYRFYLVRAELGDALETTTRLLKIASSAQDRGLQMEAHQAQMFSRGFRGELAEALTHFDQCITLFEPQRFRGRMHLYSTDTMTSVLCLNALIAWLRGFADEAAVSFERALERAHEVGHAFTLAWVLNFGAVIHQIRGDALATRRLADLCVAHAKQHEFPFWLAGGRVMQGWSLVAGGEDRKAGIAEMRDGLAGWAATGAVLFSPYYLACLIEGYRMTGRSADGLEALTQMIDLVQQTGEKWWEPELHRLRGELLRDSGGLAEARAAEAKFRDAILIAAVSGSRALELRAHMSLCRLWSDLGRRAEAHDLLAGSLSGLTQGFGTGDLIEAQKLLAQLS